KELKEGSAHSPFSNLDCMKCHDAHGSNHSRMMKAAPGDLCYTCHKKEKKGFLKMYVHTPVTKKLCLSCHKPHTSPYKKLLVNSSDNLCINCHSSMLRDDGGKKSIHPPFKDKGCKTCHDPHASDYIAVTVSPMREMCAQCHKDKETKMMASRVKHSPAEDGKCNACHSPHSAAKLDNLLLNRPKELCLSCHEKIVATTARKGHMDLDCLNCHASHYADLKGLLSAQDPALCIKCHSADTERLLKAHINPVANIKRCLSCHEPHVTEKRGLLKKIKHAPFDKEGGCKACHE
ncbi:MAG: cytochrome c3 family protein, partial [Nanoarchaeota archaeon]